MELREPLSRRSLNFTGPQPAGAAELKAKSPETFFQLQLVAFLFVFVSGPLKHKAGTVCLFVFLSGPSKHKAVAACLSVFVSGPSKHKAGAANQPHELLSINKQTDRLLLPYVLKGSIQKQTEK